MTIIRSGYAPPRGRERNRTYGYDRRHWKNIRAARLTLDGHRCQLQSPGCTGTATTVDLNHELNGNHMLATLDNTQSACRHCHGHKDGEGRRRPTA